MAEDEGPNLGYKIRPKEGYFPVPPSDTLQDLRTEMALTMEQLGIKVECHHHEVATAGQCEIDMKFDTLVAMADNLMKYKYVVKNVAQAPRQDRDLHAQAAVRRQRLGHARAPVALGRRQADLRRSRRLRRACPRPALYYIGGLLKHAPALLAFAAPTTNCYHRLVPGYEAPVNLA